MQLKTTKILDTAIGTKFAPTYACILKDEIETKFIERAESKPSVWFWCVVDFFVIWAHGKQKPDEFLNDCTIYCLDVKFTHESDKESIFYQEVIGPHTYRLNLMAGISICTLYLHI